MLHLAVLGVMEGDVQQQPHVRIVESVVGPTARTAHGDDAMGAQQLQGMGDRGIRLPGGSGQLAHADLAVAQREQQSQPARVSEQGEDVREVGDVGRGRDAATDLLGPGLAGFAPLLCGTGYNI